jgi:hypothetical protein
VMARFVYNLRAIRTPLRYSKDQDITFMGGWT